MVVVQSIATISLSLNGQTSRKQFFDTLYNVYVSKKTSEAAPGVGEETDIAVVEAGRVFRCGQPIIEVLRNYFLNQQKSHPLNMLYYRRSR